MDKKEYFLKIFKLAEKKYGKLEKRLAADEWREPWQTLIVTIMSAQNRDETTIPVGEALLKKYPTLEKLSKAKFEDVLNIIKRLNYNRTKAKNVIAAAKFILENFDGKTPEDIDELVKIPGVGRKTANIVRVAEHNSPAIAVDTHVFRLANVLGFVNTKNADETEQALMKLAPKRYWSRINRIFVLWGKHVKGRDKKKFLEDIGME